jgi:lipopolysaccharide/colanic/teichoic acid biosynthesis glycosyltransferase
MIKLLFDRVFALFGILILLPAFLLIAIWIQIDSRGGVFFKQVRVGKNGQRFDLLKFRTMRPASEVGGKLTVGARDPRITKAGYFLRKYKIDELPQLWNVLIGEMSFVGPRPEVPEYVALYTEEQKAVLAVRPGITDEASLVYFEENELLSQSDDPYQTYVEVVMPEKLRINLDYLKRRSFFTDLGVIAKTIKRIVS